MANILSDIFIKNIVLVNQFLILTFRLFHWLCFAVKHFIIGYMIQVWSYSNSPSSNKKCRSDIMLSNCHFIQIYFMIFVYKTGWILMNTWLCHCVLTCHVTICWYYKHIQFFQWKRPNDSLKTYNSYYGVAMEIRHLNISPASSRLNCNCHFAT